MSVASDSGRDPFAEAGSDRRHFLRSAASLLAIGLECRTTSGAAPATGTAADAASRGRRFLAGLFDPAVSLLPEFRGSRVYWLYHDNYLAAKILDATNPEMARKVVDAIRHFGVSRSGKIEILFGEAKQPLPFRHYRLEAVKRVGEKVIKTEVVGPEIHKDWARYADLLFLAAIAESRSGKAEARERFEAGMRLWDGKGFRDWASAQGKRYATYKLALGLIAAARVGRTSAVHGELLGRLLKMQQSTGGFVTDYTVRGNPIGQANVETTALAILALDGDR